MICTEASYVFVNSDYYVVDTLIILSRTQNGANNMIIRPIEENKWILHLQQATKFAYWYVDAIMKLSKGNELFLPFFGDFLSHFSNAFSFDYDNANEWKWSL